MVDNTAILYRVSPQLLIQMCHGSAHDDQRYDFIYIEARQKRAVQHRECYRWGYCIVQVTERR